MERVQVITGQVGAFWQPSSSAFGEGRRYVLELGSLARQERQMMSTKASSYSIPLNLLLRPDPKLFSKLVVPSIVRKFSFGCYGLVVCAALDLLRPFPYRCRCCPLLVPSTLFGTYHLANVRCVNYDAIYNPERSNQASSSDTRMDRDRQNVRVVFRKRSCIQKIGQLRLAILHRQRVSDICSFTRTCAMASSDLPVSNGHQDKQHLFADF